MTKTDLLQFLALALMPIGIALVVLAIGGPVMATGSLFIVLAPELWLVGREFDIRGGDEQ